MSASHPAVARAELRIRSPVTHSSGSNSLSAHLRAKRPTVGTLRASCERRVAEREGFEPPCRLPGKTLSRRPRYDHFGTSPFITTLGAKPLAARSGRRFAGGSPALACGRRRFLDYARQSPSLRARAAASRRFPPALACGRRRFLTTLGAKPLAGALGPPLRAGPPALSAAAGAFYYARGKAPRCALGPPLCGGSLRPSLAAAGAFLLRSGQSPSLRARVAVRGGRFPPAARLRPQALSYYARGNAPPAFARRDRNRASARQAAARNSVLSFAARPEKVLNHLAAFSFEQAADRFHPVIQRRVLVRPHR